MYYVFSLNPRMKKLLVTLTIASAVFSPDAKKMSTKKRLACARLWY